MADAVKVRRTRPTRSSLQCRACGYGYSDVCWVAGYRCPNCGRINYQLYREEHLNPGHAMFMSDAEIEREIATASITDMVVVSKDMLNTLRNPDWRPEHPRRASQ